MVGVSCLPYQVLEDQLNMIEVPSGGGDPFLVMSPAMGGHSWRAEVLGELFQMGLVGLEEEGTAAHGLLKEAGMMGDDLLHA